MEGYGTDMNSKIMYSVIIPTRNEEDYIADCLNSLLKSSKQTIEQTEFIIVDGRSTDRTLEIVKEEFKHLENIRIVDNPNLHQSYAMNLGAWHSSGSDRPGGSIIIRADAHSVYPERYIDLCFIAACTDTSVWNSGAIQKSVGINTFTSAIASVMNSRFGMGKVKYRFPSDESYQLSDTAYLGCWWKSNFIELGGFNEDFKINEDYELNIRIRKRGQRVGIYRNLEVKYFVRNSFFGLAKQFFSYGLWKVKTLYIHPSSIKPRQLVPVLFVLYLGIISVGYSFFSFYSSGLINYFSGFIGFIWFLLILSIWIDDPKLVNVLLIPIVVMTIHLSWGIGFIFGIFYWSFRAINKGKNI